jgi:hypothetical protein
MLPGTNVLKTTIKKASHHWKCGRSSVPITSILLAVGISAQDICEKNDDVAAASLIENWLEETERRTWSLWRRFDPLPFSIPAELESSTT